MSKSKLLVLDTNVIIFLLARGIWDKLVEACDVYLAKTIVDETQFYDDENGTRHYVDLSCEKRVYVFDVPMAEVSSFLQQFEPIYADQLDPGELEALAFLFSSSETYMICSGDAIVYRTLGRLNRPDQGISLEELLPQIGLSQSNLPYPQTQKFRKYYSQEGFKDSLSGIGLRKKTGK